MAIDQAMNQVFMLSLVAGSLVWMWQEAQRILSQVAILELFLFLTAAITILMLVIGLVQDNTSLLLTALLVMVCAFGSFVMLGTNDE